MAPSLTRSELSSRRSARQRRQRRRRRRAVAAASVPVAIVILIAVIVAMAGGSSREAPAAPVPSPDLGSGAPPPDVVIARAGAIEVHLPVDPRRVTAAAFHPVGDPASVGMDDADTIAIHRAGRAGRAGPDTAGLDVGAPAGTRVYSPVDGTVLSVSPYRLFGRVEGYAVTIRPSQAADGVALRVSHLDAPAEGEGTAPTVGRAVQAGVTVLGRVRDLSEVAEQELSAYTADSGNHVALELIRTSGDLIP